MNFAKYTSDKNQKVRHLKDLVSLFFCSREFLRKFFFSIGGKDSKRGPKR